MLRWINRKAVAAGVYARYGALTVRRSIRQRAHRRTLDRAPAALTFRLHAPVGLFAHLSWCLHIVAYCESRGIAPRLACTSPQYGEDGGDWFPFLFDQPRAPQLEPAKTTLTVREFQELPFYRQPLALSLHEAAQLQRDYFPVAARISEKVRRFATAHFRRGSTLGCHFRGTDKEIEARRVDYHAVSDLLRERLSELAGEPLLFVATDEMAFLEHVRSALEGVEIVSYDSRRSISGTALHLDPAHHGREHAEEALIDSLLLADCDAVVKSPSALSAWSAVFNPDLPVQIIGRPYQHALFYPETALLRQTDTTTVRRD